MSETLHAELLHFLTCRKQEHYSWPPPLCFLSSSTIRPREPTLIFITQASCQKWERERAGKMIRGSDSGGRDVRKYPDIPGLYGIWITPSEEAFNLLMTAEKQTRVPPAGHRRFRRRRLMRRNQNLQTVCGDLRGNPTSPRVKTPTLTNIWSMCETQHKFTCFNRKSTKLRLCHKLDPKVLMFENNTEMIWVYSLCAAQ